MLNYKILWLNPRSKLYDEFYIPEFYKKHQALVINNETRESRELILSLSQWKNLSFYPVDKILNNLSVEDKSFLKPNINRYKQLKLKTLLNQVQIL